MNNQRGFTLIEILAAITILFLIGTAFFQFFISSQKGTNQSQEKLEALNIAQTVLERVKQGDYPEITGSGTYICASCNSEERNNKYTFVVNEHRYDIKIEVKEDDLDLYLVTVYVKDSKDIEKSSAKGLVEL